MSHPAKDYSLKIGELESNINIGNLAFYLKDFLFKGIDLNGKKVLDIGGGYGLFSLYSAFAGANEVVILEPESAGSHSDMNDKFIAYKEMLALDNVELVSGTLQEYESAEKYDVILLHNAINHLDEPACIELKSSSEAQKTYLDIFKKIWHLTGCHGHLIACDCSRYNFFQLLRLQNPFAKSIEWHKHQHPSIWTEILVEAGYSQPIVHWSSFSALRTFGQALLANSIMAYFCRSHFRLQMQKICA